MFKVLIIDDTKSVHAFVKSLLAKAQGVEVTSVFDGAQAVSLLKEKKPGESAFDLILLDWEMPNLNGPSTFQELIKLGVKTPTVMMTTKNTTDDISKMLGMGVAEYLIKPFTIDILFEKIEFASGKALSYVA